MAVSWIIHPSERETDRTTSKAFPTPGLRAHSTPRPRESTQPPDQNPTQHAISRQSIAVAAGPLLLLGSLLFGSRLCVSTGSAHERATLPPTRSRLLMLVCLPRCLWPFCCVALHSAFDRSRAATRAHCSSLNISSINTAQAVRGRSQGGLRRLHPNERRPAASSLDTASAQQQQPWYVGRD